MSKSVSVNTLTYNSKIVGYRISVDDGSTTKFYDLEYGVAEKYGVARGMVGIEVPLIDFGGLLLSKQEKERNITVEDISKNITFIKELSSYKNNRRSDKDIKQRKEEDKKKALQMDKFNRLLKICVKEVLSGGNLSVVKGVKVVKTNLDKEIDKVLVSQGVFTLNKNLNNRLKQGVLSYINNKGYKYIDITE